MCGKRGGTRSRLKLVPMSDWFARSELNKNRNLRWTNREKSCLICDPGSFQKLTMRRHILVCEYILSKRYHDDMNVSIILQSDLDQSLRST